MRRLVFTLLASALGSALESRGLSANDQSVLSLALFLENLENALQFTAAGFPKGFRDGIEIIAKRTSQHASAITLSLHANGVTAMAPCTYSFQYDDPASSVVLANTGTRVGIGAYLGGLKRLTDSNIYHRLSASVLTVKGHHNAFLRTGIGASTFSIAYDTGLTTIWVFNLLQQLVVSCAQSLPIIQLPKLTLTSPIPGSRSHQSLPAGTQLAFKWDPSKLFVALDSNAPLFAILNQNVSLPVFQTLTKTTSNTGWVKKPEGMSGAAFACLTTFASGLTICAQQ